MAKKLSSVVLVFVSLMWMSGMVQATDYSTLSTEELSRLRGSFATASQEERTAFHTEWQKRLNVMSPEELQRYTGPGKGPGRGQGMGSGQGKGTPYGRSDN